MKTTLLSQRVTFVQQMGKLFYRPAEFFSDLQPQISFIVLLIVVAGAWQALAVMPLIRLEIQEQLIQQNLLDIIASMEVPAKLWFIISGLVVLWTIMLALCLWFAMGCIVFLLGKLLNARAVNYQLALTGCFYAVWPWFLAKFIGNGLTIHQGQPVAPPWYLALPIFIWCGINYVLLFYRTLAMTRKRAVLAGLIITALHLADLILSELYPG